MAWFQEVNVMKIASNVTGRIRGEIELNGVLKM